MNYITNKKLTREKVLTMPKPKHIAFIMDGNGRWATKRLLPRNVGHNEGVKTLEKIVNEVFALDIPVMSVYAFSTENWSRPESEINALFTLIREYFAKTINRFIDKGIRVIFMGDLDRFPQDLREIIDDMALRSKNLTKGIFNIGLNYGARSEIVAAAKKIVETGLEISEENFSKCLYTSELPDPDILVRTSGEMRLSNFMMYQAAYSELFFTDTLWPDFSTLELYNIIEQFNKRNRRFGKIN